MTPAPGTPPGSPPGTSPGNPPGDPSPIPQHSLFAPWRLEYLDDLENRERRAGTASGSPAAPTHAPLHDPAMTAPRHPAGACFLCDYWLDPAGDERNHVIVRTADGLILLNRYPYANGHLLVALGEGRPRLLDYDPPQRAALWALVEQAADLLERTLQPQGINIGLNQGRAAGAGVPQHIHVHLVPRWHGDVNFMAVVGRVRVIPSSLDAMAARFRLARRDAAAPSPGSHGNAENAGDRS